METLRHLNLNHLQSVEPKPRTYIIMSLMPLESPLWIIYVIKYGMKSSKTFLAKVIIFNCKIGFKKVPTTVTASFALTKAASCHQCLICLVGKEPYVRYVIFNIGDVVLSDNVLYTVCTSVHKNIFCIICTI